MATIINTKVGENRGKKRIWMEGRKLEREGFVPGKRYDLEADEKDSRLTLKLSETGKFTVSKRERNGVISPIIDLTTEEVSKVFAGSEALRIAIKDGSMLITQHYRTGKIAERVSRLMDKLNADKPLDVCSLFHGGGVLDKAVHAGLDAGTVKSRVGVAVEIEGKYLDASLRNNAELWSEESVVIESPIQDVSLRNVPQMDIVCGGIPCTGASKSGRSKNKLEHAESHEAAGAMFFNFLQFVEAVNPSIVIIENVPEYANTASMAVIRSVLSTQGYSLQEHVFDGLDFNALEKRRRLCCVAISKGLEGVDFDLEQLRNVTLEEKAGRILSDILEPVALDSDRWKSFDYLAEKELRDKAAGKGFSRQLLTGEESSCGTIGKDYAKCRSTEPFLVHPEDSALSRIFTPLEHARLKGVPKSVIDGLSDTVAHQILGQSVIFPVFKAIAEALGNSLRNYYQSICSAGNAKTVVAA